jgi:hypothetical protein
MPSKRTLLAGRIISGVVTAFMLFDGIFKLPKPAPVVDSFKKLGYDPNIAIPIGVLALLCAILYAIPRTAVLGAILLTGYLGGAVATHVRVSDPLFTHILFPVYFGVLAWVGLYLRDERLRALVPVRT